MEANDEVVDRNYDWFKKSLSDLMLKFSGQYLLIVDESVSGAYPSFEEALNEAMKNYEPGKFIIQKCCDESETTQVICSLMRLPKTA
ncbi:hypothetical protein FACS1894216_06560 [Synergistales bacterium]|nr:hypothetical protein FACS1894216_06560 [Synergistales bacterium]